LLRLELKYIAQRLRCVWRLVKEARKSEKFGTPPMLKGGVNKIGLAKLADYLNRGGHGLVNED